MNREKGPRDSNERLRQRALKLLGASRADVSSLSPVEVAELVYELRIHYIELERQNEELREAQVKLAEVRDRYEDLYEYAPVGYMTIDHDGAVVSANLTAATLLGVERDSLPGKRFADFVDAACRDVLSLHYRGVFQESFKQTCELKLRPAVGEDIYVQIESRAMGEANEISRCRTTITDITELRKTRDQLQLLNESLEELVRNRTHQLQAINAQLRQEIARRHASTEALRREKDFNETLVNTARIIILVLDEEGRIVSFNRYMEELSGYKLEEVRGKDWFSTFIPESERGAIMTLFDEAIGGTRVRGRTNAIATRDGSEREIEWHDSELKDADGKFLGLLCAGQDVTERISLEEQLLTIAEREQQRIGAHIHDDLGQELVASRLAVDTLVEGLRAEDSGEVERAAAIGSALARSSRKLRELSRGLIRSSVTAEGLFSALDDLCGQLSALEEIHCHVSCDPDVSIADDRTATQLYYIAKEALTNALKHGRVDGLWVNVSLTSDGERNVLMIRDNGVGITEEVADRKGNGLKIMRDRAGLIDASLEIASHPQGGTEVVCTVASAVTGQISGRHTGPEGKRRKLRPELP